MLTPSHASGLPRVRNERTLTSLSICPAPFPGQAEPRSHRASRGRQSWKSWSPSCTPRQGRHGEQVLRSSGPGSRGAQLMDLSTNTCSPHPQFYPLGPSLHPCQRAPPAHAEYSLGPCPPLRLLYPRLPSLWSQVQRPIPLLILLDLAPQVPRPRWSCPLLLAPHLASRSVSCWSLQGQLTQSSVLGICDCHTSKSPSSSHKFPWPQVPSWSQWS